MSPFNFNIKMYSIFTPNTCLIAIRFKVFVPFHPYKGTIFKAQNDSQHQKHIDSIFLDIGMSF